MQRKYNRGLLTGPLLTFKWIKYYIIFWSVIVQQNFPSSFIHMISRWNLGIWQNRNLSGFPHLKNKICFEPLMIFIFLISASYLEFVETNTGVIIDPWRNKIYFAKWIKSCKIIAKLFWQEVISNFFICEIVIGVFSASSCWCSGSFRRWS